MMFQDWIFLPFFLVSYAVYLALKNTRFRNLWIVIISYAFYAFWNPIYLIMITYALTVDFFMTWLMDGSKRKRLWLTISLVNDVGLLGFFLYAGFVVENINLLLEKIGSANEVPSPGLLMSVGLSFYLFKSISYVMDCYRGDIDRERNYITYAAFISFFPLLVAGPIERAGNLLAQLKGKIRVSALEINEGISLFVMGLFKKVVMADGLAVYVKSIYDKPAEQQAPALLLATFAFAWQIYFDFSGYSDMARGVARMFGFKIMLNFNNPYLATGLSDFWARWHISLSAWFRDYVYIPLGGNRKGEARTYFNLFLTMVVSGLWHGAAWTFIVWGAVHGLGLGLTKTLEQSTFYKEKVPRLVKQVFCFLIVSFAWIFFRANTWDDACLIIKRIFTSGISDPSFPLIILALILPIWLYQFIYESRAKRILQFAPLKIALVILMILYMVVFAGEGQPFTYAAF